jgi:hypothetical protein
VHPIIMAAAVLASAIALAAPTIVDEAYPTDCRNQTWEQDGGNLVVMSWHIHYNTMSSDMERFYNGFISEFGDKFNPVQYPGFEKNQCPFGPNFGDNTFKCARRIEGATHVRRR